MPRDTSLDEFLGTEDEDGTDPEPAERVESDEEVADPDPAERSADDADDSDPNPAERPENDPPDPESAAGTPSDSGTEAADAPPVDPTSVGPAQATYEWRPDGAACAACGERVTRRWRAEGEADGEMVCADCKEW